MAGSRRLLLAGVTAVLAGGLAAGCGDAEPDGDQAADAAFAPSGWTYLVADVELPGGDTPGETTLQAVMTVVSHRLDAEIPQHEAQLGSGRVEFAIPPDEGVPSGLEASTSTDIQLRPVTNVVPLPSGTCPPLDGQQLCDHEATEVYTLEPDILPDDALSGATAEQDSTGSGWLVEVEFTDDGQGAVKDWTGDHVGEQLAIVRDDVVVFAPMVQEPVPGPLLIAGYSEDAATLLAAELHLAASGATWTVESAGSAPPR